MRDARSDVRLLFATRIVRFFYGRRRTLQLGTALMIGAGAAFAATNNIWLLTVAAGTAPQ